MTTTTNKMFFRLRKLRNAIHDIQDFRYRDRIFLQELLGFEDEKDEGPYVIPTDIDWKTVKVGDHWIGRDKYWWIKIDMDIPKAWEGKKIYGFFDFGHTGGGHNSGFESLAYLNGVPYQGVDSNHKELFLPRELAGKTITMHFRLWSGLEGGGIQRDQVHRFSQASFGWLDEAVDDLYFTAEAVLDTIEQLPETNEHHVNLIAILDRAFQVIDWTVVHQPDVFYETLYEAQRLLREGIESLEKNTDVTIHAVGHTHIDVAWLWRLKHTREKSIRSFSTVLRLMELYPEYLFLQSQPRLYDYVKEDYPEVYEQIKARVAEGRWDANGAMWVEPDCNIPSGESLVRQLLYGKTFFNDEFGKESNFLWLPDVFGYSWAMPQILKKAGIDTFITSKISWNQYNKIPHDTFTWKGIDGTEILTHMITTPEIHQSKDSWFYTYNGNIHAFTVKETWDRYIDKDVNKDLLLSYGWGDGGGGVERRMLEMRRRLDELPGLPNVKTQTATEYMEILHQNIDETDRYVHKWDGELYLEYHRGTYTSQAKTKWYNRYLENLYRQAEMLGIFHQLATNKITPYTKEALDEGWKIILTNQFHDILPGTSIPEVYEDAMIDFKEAETIGQTFVTNNTHPLLKEKAHAYSVFNDSNWQSTNLVTIEMKEEGHFIDQGGKQLVAQRIDGGYHVLVTDIKPLAFKVITFVPKAVDTDYVLLSIDQTGIETPFYQISFNESGHMTRIYDKLAKRDVLEEGKSGNVIQTFEDRPMFWDAWDIDLFYQDKVYEVDNLISMNIVENGPLQAVIRFKWEHLQSTITQDMIVYAHTKRIDFKTHVDWKERRHLMKVAFPVDVRTTKATYDIQYGNVERPTHWNTSWDYARFEVVGHKWADLSDGGYGVSLLNNCKYGYDIKENVMRLTLLKSAIHPDPMADYGEHEFTYALYPHEGDWRQGKTEENAFYLNHPLHVFDGEVTQSNQSIIYFDVDHVSVDAIKKAERSDETIIRFHEFEGKKATINFQSNFEWIQVVECDLMENEIGEVATTSSIQLTIKPYEIKTYKITFK